MIKLYRSKKYGLTYSFTYSGDKADGLFYSSSKWLLARWYIHGSSSINITTEFSRQNENSVVISNKHITFLEPIGAVLNKFLSFNVSSNLFKLGSLFLGRLFLFYRLKS